MVYYVCPNCSHRSDDYETSMVHYSDCKVVRVRQGLGSPPGSQFITPGSNGTNGARGPPADAGGGGGGGGGGASAGHQYPTTPNASKISPEGQRADVDNTCKPTP
ncbi:hypothetical protein JCM3766R1_003085 [Sporobolomyces carnicolor]